MASVADPRHRNECFSAASVGVYLGEYAARLHVALGGIDADALDRARQLIEAASMEGRRIFAAGNGGSAAIADHLCCDWTKGTHVHGHPVIDTTSFTANVALYSAVANDFGFEAVFARQIGFVGRAGDVLVAISSSGNSANIIAAVDAARSAGMATIGLTGFDGGRLKDHADVSIHVDVANYGIVEDSHQIVMHVLAQFIATRRDTPDQPAGG